MANDTNINDDIDIVMVPVFLKNNDARHFLILSFILIESYFKLSGSQIKYKARNA